MPAPSAAPRSFTKKVTKTLFEMVRRARSRKRQARLRRTWAVELLEGRRLLAVDFREIATKVDSGVGGIKSSLEAIDSFTRLPLINTPIDQISQITQSLEKFQRNLKDAVDGIPSTSAERQVKDAIFAALDPIGVLQNRNGPGCSDRSCINADDIDVTLTNSTVDIKLNLGYTTDDFSSAIGLGIDSVPLKPASGTSGRFNVGVTYVDFNFGLDSNGAYFQNDPGQLQLKLQGFLPPDPFNVGLGFLTFQATDQKPGADLTLTLTSTVTSAGISTPTIGGELDLNMHLLVKVDSDGMPQLQTNFVLHWGIGTPVNPKTALGPAWGSPTLQFKDVQLSLGSVLGGIARPIARQVKEIIEPLKPLFDLLEKPIPGINDISQEVGGPTVTLLSTANTLPAALPPELLNMIRSADTLRGYYQKIDALAGLTGWLKLGDFNIADPSGNFLTGQAPSALGSVALDAAGKLLPIQLPWSNLISPSGTPNITGIKDQIRNLLGSAVGNEVVGIFEQLTKPAQENGLKFAFPIIDDPSGVALGMLLGQDKDLVLVDGRLVFDFNKEVKIKIVPGFNVLLRGAANFTAIANIGYDTRGLREAMRPLYVGGSFEFGKLPDGLWIGSTTLVNATGSMRLGPQVEIPKVASLVLQGGFDLSLHAEISNPNNLQKIRPFSGDLNDRLFRVNGEMTAKAELQLKFGFEVPPPVNFIGFKKSWPLAEATVFRFDTDSIAIPGSLAEPPVTSANLFTYFTNERQLQLHVGDDAQFRNIAASEVNENFVINHVQRFLFPIPGVFPPRLELYDIYDITFSNVGITERYFGPFVDRVVVNMGSGKDTLKVIDTGSSVVYRLRGGGGDDVIDVDGNVDAQIFGDYSDGLVHGDEGNDVLDAGNGNNNPSSRRPTTVHGGLGFDQISFGEGLLENLKRGESYLVLRDPGDTSQDRLTINNSKSLVNTKYQFINSGNAPSFPEDSRFSYRLEMNEIKQIGSGELIDFFIDPLPRIWMSKYDAVTIESGSGSDTFVGIPPTSSKLYGGSGLDTLDLDGSNAPGLPVGGFTNFSFAFPSISFFGGSGDDEVIVNDTGSSTSRSYRAAINPTKDASASIQWSESITRNFELKLSGVETTGLTVKSSDTVRVYGWDENLLMLTAGEVKLAADNSAVWDSFVFLSDTPKLTFFDGDSARGTSSGGIDYIGPYFALPNGNRFRAEFSYQTTNFGFELDRVVVDISPELLRKQWELQFAPAAHGRIDLRSTSGSYDFRIDSNKISIGTWALPYATGGIDDIRIIGGSGDDHLSVNADLNAVDISFDGGPGSSNDTVDFDRSSVASNFQITQRDADPTTSVVAVGAWGGFKLITERTEFLQVTGGAQSDFIAVIGNIKQSMVINSGGGNDTFRIGQEGSPATFNAPMFFDGGDGNDSFTWYGANNSFNPVTFPPTDPSTFVVDLVGGSGFNTLLVDDKSQSTNPSTYDIYRNRIRARQDGFNVGTEFDHHGMSSVTVNASDNNDTFNVNGTSASIAANDQFKILGNGGSDTINIVLIDSEGMPTLGGRLGISGGAGTDRVIVDESHNDRGLNYQIYNEAFVPGPTVVSGFYETGIGFSVDGDSEQLQLLAGSGDDSFAIFSYKNIGTALSINAGQGNDNLAIVAVTGSIFTNVSKFSQFAFDGGGGTDSFNFNNVTGIEPALYQRDGALLRALQLNGEYALEMNVTQYENMIVNGGLSVDLFFVDALSSNESINLNGGGGFNSFYVAQRDRSTQAIRGQIMVDGGSGGGNLFVDNSAATTGSTVHIDSGVDGTLGSHPSDTLFGPGGSLQFKNLKDEANAGTGMTLKLGSGIDTVYAAPQSNTTLSIAGGAPDAGVGDNLFVALAGVQNPNTVNLGAGAGRLTSSNRKDVSWTSFENSNLDYVAPSIIKVTNTLDSGPGSLRQAILDANATPNVGGPDLIRFALPGGNSSIRPLSQLPSITDPVVLDGTSQPGYVGKPVVELDGSLAGRSNGLVILSGGTTVRGLAINRFGLGELSNMVLLGASGNVIQGNYIGTNLDGSASYTPSPSVWGIVVYASDNNTIGTNGDGVNDTVEGNVVSGHGGAGILFDPATPGQTPDNNVIAGNFIGTSADGSIALGNGRMGIFVLASGTGNRIGTNADGVSDTAERNLISGNAEAGIYLGGNGYVVAGNYIGTNAVGAMGLPNGNGIRIERADNNRIGGTASGAGNLIAFNNNSGVSIGTTGEGNSVLGNSIFANGEIGIDLNNPGDPSNRVTPNDASDADTGPNKLQNFPSLSVAQSNNGQTLIGGTLQSTPQTTFRIEFFSSPSADPSGFGEGQVYLGAITATTDASGYASYVATFSTSVVAGHFISSTATDPQGNTSEFSRNVQVVTALEPNVAALRAPLTNSLYLVTSPSGTILTATARSTPDVTPPSNTVFPFGFLDFRINGVTPGASADVTITGLDFSLVTDYFKYGATPANTTAHWYNFLFGQATDNDSAVGTGMEIVNGTIVLHLVDGQRGDDDLVANGIIVDIGGAVSNRPPVAVNDSAMTYANAPLTISVLNNDRDADGTLDIGSVRIIGVASHGTTSINVNTGTINYTPAIGYVGTDSFTYQVKDNVGAISNLAVVSIDIKPRATITGKEFRDVTGNGLTNDDLPLAGVKVYLDTNDNGTWNPGEPTSTSLADGSFEIPDLTPGNYKVRQVTPTGFVRTLPTTRDYYSVAVASGQTVSGNNFANAALGNLSTLTNVVYVINGTTVVTDLRGNTSEGDTIQVSFTVVPGTAPQRFTLVSYTAPRPNFDANTANKQRIFDTDSGIFGPGTHTLNVSNPHSYFQVDFVAGFAIDVFGPAGSNIYYGAQNRLFSADNGGTRALRAAPASLTGTVYRDANNNGLFDSGELPIAGVIVRASGNSVTQTVVTDIYGVYTFDNLPAGTYSIFETQPNGYTDGKESLGNRGGTASNDKFSGIVLGAGISGTGYNFGEKQTMASTVAGNQTQTAAWWNSTTGQSLIKALNGGPNAKNLGNWLSTNFNNLFGADAGNAMNLANRTNVQVAALYSSLYSNAARKAETELLALALALYVTNSGLAGHTAAASNYGFAVSASGIESSTFNVGTSGAAFGVKSNTILTVREILSRANARSRKGLLWDADGNGTFNSAETILRTQAASLFSSVNNT